MSQEILVGSEGNTPPQQAVVQRGSFELTLRRLRKDKASLASAIFIIVLVCFAIAAPLFDQLTGHDVNQQFRDTGLGSAGIPTGPNAEFVLGADQLGRDVLVRLAHGARVSLLVGVAASLSAAFIGVVVGLVAGYFGGKTDTILSRLMDLVMSVPFLLCAIALVSVFGPSLPLSISVIIFFSWTAMGRVIRGQVLSLRQRDYVEAARSMGANHVSIMCKEIVPNLTVPIIIYATLMIPNAIVFEATLSFLGMGIVPPAASWGGMLSEAASNSIYLTAWWLVVFPGSTLLLTTLAFNILGDGIRDALDPRARRKA
ncbi:ABC transporter permease [Arthrobacter sp. Rue61a]|uniref:ABC transporter permease n=1 Tax=Arthrobacter sp. Rue61a TaxID=1118963 RepID=UPI00027DF43A|nr:ABC transporter permease [Arthrobacter sp. Rue61a]AFR31368.1 oligopeptide transport system permease protein AppC [Arthrobacter sp. Rue61a]